MRRARTAPIRTTLVARLVGAVGSAVTCSVALSSVAVWFMAPTASAVTAPPSGPPTSGGPTAAALGAGWLAGRVDAGVPLTVDGGVQWGFTIDAAAALVATGVGLDRAQVVWDALVAARETVVDPRGPSGEDDAGRLAKVVLLAEQLGEDPTAVGTGAGADLVARLEAARRTTGVDAGLFGAANPALDGSFRQGLALLALTAAGRTPDAAAVDWLATQQCPDGSWVPYRASTTAPCPDNDFVGPDTNMTSLAVMGLVAVGRTTPLAGALSWLDGAQNADGGWGLRDGIESEPNSTGLVVSALATAGASDESRFAGATAALLGFQLGCAALAGDRGAFTTPGTGGSPNLVSTVQAVPGALGASYPLGAGAPVEGIPAVECSGSGSSTTSTSTPPTAPAGSATSTTAAVPAPTTAPESAAAAGPASAPGAVAGASTATGAAVQPASLAVTGVATGRLVGPAVVAVLVGLVLLAMRARASDHR